MAHTLGSRIKELRNRKKWTQKEFDKVFSLAESTIGMYERNQRKPDYETLEKIANYFDVSISYMFGQLDTTPTNKVTVTGQDIYLTIEELNLFEEFKKYPNLFHDLDSDPENKVKELIKLYKMKEMFWKKNFDIRTDLKIKVSGYEYN